MPLSRRYSPEIAPGEACNIGLDYSPLIPPGIGISSGTLTLWTNSATPSPSSDMTIGTVTVAGRTVYARINALDVALGKDYQLRWVAIDTAGNVWPRTCLLLCAHTS